jgi:hypothetical protein
MYYYNKLLIALESEHIKKDTCPDGVFKITYFKQVIMLLPGTKVYYHFLYEFILALIESNKAPEDVGIRESGN